MGELPEVDLQVEYRHLKVNTTKVDGNPSQE